MGEKTYHHEDLREELIDAGIKLLDADGYEKFSLRNVAKACGVSHTAPYRHFKSKEELLSGIAAKIDRQFNDSLKAAVAAHPDNTAAQIDEMGYTYISFFLKNPVYLRLAFLSDFDKSVFLDSGSCCPMKETVFYKTIRRYAAEKQQENSEADIDTDILALKLWGLVHGITVLLVHGDFQYDGDIMDLVRRIIWEK
jgi:AcrR family transcriptional regulator